MMHIYRFLSTRPVNSLLIRRDILKNGFFIPVISLRHTAPAFEDGFLFVLPDVGHKSEGRIYARDSQDGVHFRHK
jgi:hypothetical protein